MTATNEGTSPSARLAKLSVAVKAQATTPHLSTKQQPRFIKVKPVCTRVSGAERDRCWSNNFDEPIIETT